MLCFSQFERRKLEFVVWSNVRNERTGMLYTSPECAEGQGNLPSCTLFGCFAIAWRRHHTARLQQLASDGQNGEQVDMNAYVFTYVCR